MDTLWEHEFFNELAFSRDFIDFGGKYRTEFTDTGMKCFPGKSGKYEQSSTDIRKHRGQVLFFAQENGEPRVWKVPEQSFVNVESVIRAQVIIGILPSIYSNHVDDQEDDIRLAATSQIVIDYQNWLVLDFFLTNKSIYAFYERLPYGWNNNKRYHAFSWVKKIYTRSHPDQWHKLRLRYGKDENKAQWYIEDQLLCELTNLGEISDHIGVIQSSANGREMIIVDHGGKPESVMMETISVGFGHFSLLDAYPTHNIRDRIMAKGGNLQGLMRFPGPYRNPLDGKSHPQYASTKVNDRGLRLFGQGSICEIQYLKVFSEKPVKSA